MAKRAVRQYVYDVAGQTVVMELLDDGTYHACGTARIYTAEQWAVGVARILAGGGRLVREQGYAASGAVETIEH